MSESPKKPSSWRLFSWRTAIIAVVLIYTLIGFVGVPWIAKDVVLPKVSEQLGQEISVEKIRCNPFTLALTVEGLSVPDRSGLTMLSFDRLYANLQASSLFQWALVLKELRIENPFAAIRRLPDKEINLLEVVEAFKSDEPKPEEEKGLPRAVLQKIRMDGGRFELADLAREEPLKWEAGPSQLHLDNISTLPGKEGENDFVIGLPEGGTVEINGDVVVEPLGLDGSLEFDKIVLANAWPVIGDKFEFDLAGGAMSASFRYQVRLENDEIKLSIDGADFLLTDLDLKTKGEGAGLATVGSVSIEGVAATWPEQVLRAESLVVDGANANVWLNEDGSPSWADLVPKETQDKIVETYEEVKEKIDVDAKLARFEIKNASASFENRTFSEPHRVDITGAALALTDISSEPGSEWGLVASAGLGGDSKAAAKGTFVAVPVTLDVQVGLESLDLSQFQTYVEQAAPLELLGGVLNTVGTVRLAPQDETGKIKFQGGLTVKDLDLDETVTGGTLIGWGDLKVDGIEATLAPMTLKVAKADVYSAGLEIAVAEDGTINLLQFTSALGGEEEAASEGEEVAAVEPETEAADESNLPPAEIAAFELHDCYGVYRDATTPIPFERKLEAINGTVSNITTQGKTPADIEINAGIDSGGAVTVSGQMDLLKYTRLTDLAVDISQVQLPPMSPMSVKIIGYPIERGRTSLDLDYQITDYQLQSTNHVEVFNLQLGAKVEGEGKIKAPIKMGVSMLKNKNGQITLDIPMEGDLRDPEFVVGSAISAAIAAVAGDLVKSPFRMLGRMVGGGSDQDLGHVDFPAGNARLTVNATTNLTTLAEALQERPELSLEVAGTYNSKIDMAGLREAALYESFGVDTSADRPEAVPLRKLESRYESETSPSEAAMVRGRYMADDGSLDEQGYHEDLWNQLLATQAVTEADVQALAPARAEAIRSFLVDQHGTDNARVIVLPDSVKGETGDGTVRLKLSLSAE